MSLRASALVLSCLFVSSCTPMMEPELTITVSNRTIDGLGDDSAIRVLAVDSEGKAGTGTVRFTSTAGDFKDGRELPLNAGEAVAGFACVRAMDPNCIGSVRITVEWVVKGKLVTATTNLTVTPPAGVDAGVDAGMGMDAGVDAGMDAGMSDAGLSTLTLATSKPRVFMNVGDFADVTATYQVNGMPVAGQTINFSATVGVLGPADGGTATASMLSEVTNSAGQAAVRFSEMGTPGMATVTANGPNNTSTDAGIEVVAVNAITYVGTTCGGTSCNIMGIRGSGFNETALVRFALKDALNRPVQGVRVTFALQNAPTGTTVAPSAVSDATGFVDANVQSGLTIGTFALKATVIPNQIETTSPTIGVRGAKPSNLGFTMQCGQVNVAAYRSPTPPAAQQVACTLTLVDRYGNPVGTGTAVRLNSEAGRVPNQVSTVAFMPMGANTDEGKGTFQFDTVGPFPAEDVPPLAAATGQYPFARALEPSWNDGPLTRNPRDGLLTVIAYVQGEEHFYDDNTNGMRDSNERFIDQGEPLVDRNDNNVWDPGEVYIDTNSDNMWTGPNGTWDSNTTVWTKLFLLYTDYSDPSALIAAGGLNFVPNTFNVPRATSTTLDVFMPDRNLNRVEIGTTVMVRHTATKGAVSTMGLATNLDGYGFQVEAMRLVNATATGPCAASEPRCVFATIFGTWSGGYIGQVRIDGAAASDMTAAQADTITVETTVRGATNGAPVFGTIQ